MTAFADRLRSVVSDGDKRLIRGFKFDDAKARHMGWMRWYYPDLAGQASAVTFGCPVFCRYCFVDHDLKYPKPAEDMLARIRARYPQAGYFTGSEVAERLARLGKTKDPVANRVAETEVFLTPAFALAFIGATLRSERRLTIESTCLELSEYPDLGREVCALVAPQGRRTRVTAHLLAPAPELMKALCGRDGNDHDHNVEGIGRIAATGAEMHIVLNSFYPPTLSDNEWEAALAGLPARLRAADIDPRALELRPTRPYGEVRDNLMRQYPGVAIDRSFFARQYARTVAAWGALVPGYELPYSEQRI